MGWEGGWWRWRRSRRDEHLELTNSEVAITAWTQEQCHVRQVISTITPHRKRPNALFDRCCLRPAATPVPSMSMTRRHAKPHFKWSQPLTELIIVVSIIDNDIPEACAGGVPHREPLSRTSSRPAEHERAWVAIDGVRCGVSARKFMAQRGGEWCCLHESREWWRWGRERWRWRRWRRRWQRRGSWRQR